MAQNHVDVAQFSFDDLGGSFFLLFHGVDWGKDPVDNYAGDTFSLDGATLPYDFFFFNVGDKATVNLYAALEQSMVAEDEIA